MGEMSDGRVQLLRGYPWIDKFYPPRRRCRVRVLMVADASLDFSTGGFGLSELVSIVASHASPWVTVEITTAHRGGGVADVQGFEFDTASPAVTRTSFDQIWLFGFDDRNNSLSAAELQVIADFMSGGGGVFATGDHEELGAGLCGQIPRVRSMRKWFWYTPLPAGQPKAPDGGSADRLDTVSKGHDSFFQFSDQSDDVPQRLYPRYYLNAAGTDAYPHPLLRSASGDITVFPDHPHEGECVVPANLAATYDFGLGPVDEYPPDPSGARPAPDVVAFSMSAAGYLTDAGKPPVAPRSFGAIGVYDGRLTNVGRVVVDATWHHFININLNGTGSGDPAKRGLYDAANNPTADYIQIQRYFRNIMSWLTPIPIWRCWHYKLFPVLRYVYPLIEELPQPDPEPDWHDIVRIGRLVETTVSQLFSKVDAIELAMAVSDLASDDRGGLLQGLFDPWSTTRSQDPDGGEGLNVGVLSETVRHAVLGGAMLAVAAGLPADPNDAADQLARDDDELIDKLLRSGVDHGLRQFASAVERDVERQVRLARRLA